MKNKQLFISIILICILSSSILLQQDLQYLTQEVKKPFKDLKQV